MAAANPQNCLVFRSRAFNTTDEKDYFINPCCFGDDVANWFLAELRKQGFATDDEPGQEDFGWYLGFVAAGVPHQLVIGFRPDDAEGDWICSIERGAGLLGSLFGKRREISPEAVQALHRILLASPAVSSVRLCGDREA